MIISNIFAVLISKIAWNKGVSAESFFGSSFLKSLGAALE